jgi:hypothetical protein
MAAIAIVVARPSYAAPVSLDRWTVAGPGTLAIRQARDAQIGRQVELIEFKPDTAHGGEYWCNAGVPFSPPQQANTVTLRFKSSENRQLVIKLIDSAGRAAYYNVQGADHWTQATLTTSSSDSLEGPAGAMQDIAAVQFILFNPWFAPGADFKVFVSDLNIVNDTSLAPKPMYHLNWLPSRKPTPVPGYRIETCIWNVWHPGDSWGTGDAEFDAFEKPQGQRVALDVQKHLVDEYKNVGMDFPYISGSSGAMICSKFAGIGGFPMAEGHNKVLSDDELKARNALATGPQGETMISTGTPDLSTDYDCTNPDVLKACQDRLLTSAKAGARAYRVVDYVWPWQGGGMKWGYGPSAIKRWREDLSGTDTGIEITENGKRRIAKFGEYFASYHGYTPQPAECGLTSWAHFYPPKPGQPDTPELQNSTKIYSLLFHYEWVKFANEESRPSTAFGCQVQPICNPEAFDNGTDLYWLMKCAFVRGFCAEWWGSAGVIVGN